MNDHYPRPQKRQRVGELTDGIDLSDWHSSPSPLTSVFTSSEPSFSLRPFPPQILQLALPGLFVHPPAHESYPLSLFLSLRALGTYLELKALTPDVECRTWSGLAEANGLEVEVEKAIGKWAPKHPSLRLLRHHLSLLNAHFSFQSNNAKFSRALLQRLIASFMPSDPPSIVYEAHLALITQLTSAPRQPTTTSTPGNRKPGVPRISVLVMAGMWDPVGDALGATERALCLALNDGEDLKHPKGQESHEAKQPTPEANSVKDASPTQGPKATEALTLSLTAHVFILGTIYHMHAGYARSVEPHLATLHTLVDSGTLVGGTNADGLVEIPLPGHGSVHLRTTHPRILFLLTFLLSTVAKRDPVGRRPKKWVFAECGVTQCRERREVLLWASWSAVEIEQRTLRIEADQVMQTCRCLNQRSDPDAAENHLATLIAHTQTYDFFPVYAARIALHHAHLAHGVGDIEHAGICYRVAHLDGAARASEALFHIGLPAAQSPPQNRNAQDPPREGPDFLDSLLDGLASIITSVFNFFGAPGPRWGSSPAPVGIIAMTIANGKDGFIQDEDVRTANSPPSGNTSASHGATHPNTPPPVPQMASDLFLLQHVDGSFTPSPALHKIVGDEVLGKAEEPGVDKTVWTTAVVVAYLKKHLEGEPDLFDALLAKAQQGSAGEKWRSEGI
ncbi:hypothetical protein BU15DRAFT_78151 [Melanogaster broomeanus]|nr:hypothetical protein BU15DRAFT_78151 [Melanogaster broomeanus]